MHRTLVGATHPGDKEVSIPDALHLELAEIPYFQVGDHTLKFWGDL